MDILFDCLGYESTYSAKNRQLIICHHFFMKYCRMNMDHIWHLRLPLLIWKSLPCKACNVDHEEENQLQSSMLALQVKASPQLALADKFGKNESIQYRFKSKSRIFNQRNYSFLNPQYSLKNIFIFSKTQNFHKESF